MKDWFLEKDGLITAILFWTLSVLYLFLGIREHNSFDFALALLALVVGIVNFARYFKK